MRRVTPKVVAVASIAFPGDGRKRLGFSEADIHHQASERPGFARKRHEFRLCWRRGSERAGRRIREAFVLPIEWVP